MTESTVVDPDDVSEVAATVVFMLLERLAECRRTEQDSAARLRAELASAHAVIDEHRELPPLERIKRTVVEIGRSSRPVGAALMVYRRLRRRA